MKQPPSPHDTQDGDRLMRFALIAAIIFLGYHFLFEKPQLEKMQQQQQQQAQKSVVPTPAAAPEEVKPRADIIAATSRIAIHGDKVTGSISLTGARIDDLSLNDQYTTIDKKEHIELLSPSGSKDAYYVEGGWTSDDKTAVLPDEKTLWSLAPGSAHDLATGSSITLRWDNGHGLIFERNIALDENYLFTVTQTVTNKTNAAVKLNAWHLVSRHSMPVDFTGGSYIHEGPLADLDDKLKELSYKDLTKGDTLEQDNVGGWLGITDKYWFVGIFSDPQEKFNARIIGSKTDTAQSYQTDIVSDTQTAAPGQSLTDKKFIFAGVKNLPLINAYQKKYGFKHMDLTFDFGIFFFITKPFFYLLHFLMSLTGNVGMAILLVTVIIRAAMFPLASKSFRSMAGMKKIQEGMKRIEPEIKALKEKYGTGMKFQEEVAAIYQRENINPLQQFGGCWPMLVQIPIFIALYKSILLSVELRHAPFWGWIHDLSAPDPTNIFTLFGLIPWSPPINVGAWPCLVCLTMIIQMRLSPPPPDKTQAQMQSFMPFIFVFMFGKFAAGLVIYYTWSSTLGVLQQYYILRKIGGQAVSLLRGHSDRHKKKHPPAHG